MEQADGVDSGWMADWIGGAPLLRKRFSVGTSVERAVVQVTALGICEVSLNGKRIGESHLLPGWTDYRKRVYIHSFEVTDLLLAGENVLGAMLAPGWFAGWFGPFEDKGYYGEHPLFSCNLEIAYADGVRESVCTDASWKGADGPILSADLLMGETYDARKEILGWNEPDFDAAAWQPVRLALPSEPLPERIECYPGKPVKTIAQLPALRQTEPTPGVHIFDLGQNMVGVVTLKIDAPAGTEVVLRHGEMLNADGTLYTENLRKAQATDRYIAKGGGEEVWTPRFTFHGFRYVELSGLPHVPKLDAVTGQVWMSALAETGTFECSDEKVNQLFRNIQWGFRGNYLEVPTDCPQRDERLGWTGDTQMFIRSASYLADIRPFYKKWLVDLHDAQADDGGYPDVAPWMGRLGYARAGWADAGIICPCVLWQAYGDLDFVRPWWPQMKKYMQLICAEGNVHNGPKAESYGDWLHMDAETPVPLIGLAYRAYDAQLMAAMATALGVRDDAERFEAEAANSRALFRDGLFVGDEVGVRTQTACALAIAMELLSGADLERAQVCLVECLNAREGYLSTGFVGTGYLCPALTKMGRADLAIQLLLNEAYPSWLYSVNSGATTIWERWNSWTKEGGFGDVGMNSFNHYAFGSVCEWMFESLVGMKPGSPGFERVVVEPCLTDRFDFVAASYQSIHGQIRVRWERAENGFNVELETPVEADVRLPFFSERVAPGRYVYRVAGAEK